MTDLNLTGQHFIAGNWLSGDAMFDSAPSTGPVRRFSEASQSHVDAAVAAAARAALALEGPAVAAAGAALAAAVAAVILLPLDKPRRLQPWLKSHIPRIVLLAAAFFLSPFAGMDFAQAEEKNRVFEIRTYYANEGKLDALLARFRDHTVALFEKHGMTNVGYWVPADNKENKTEIRKITIVEGKMGGRTRSNVL